MHSADKLAVVSGGRSLRGEIALEGAKNVAIKALPAALLSSEPVVLHRVPTSLRDVQICIEMMRSAGADVAVDGTTVTVHAARLGERVERPGNASIRTSVLFLAPLLARLGQAIVPEPGGDAIGARSYDLHVLALENLGATVTTGPDATVVAKVDGRLHGGPISFRVRTTGGTETALLAAVTATGLTEIYNAHTRPEVRDLVGVLRAMGADIEIPCSGLIRVRGVDRLHGAEYELMTDPVEAFTYLTAGAATSGDVTVHGADIRALEVPLIFLRESGADVRVDGSSIRVVGSSTVGPMDIAASAFPGLETDFQPLLGALALLGQGRSRIADLVFPERFEYAAQMALNGADIEIGSGAAVFHGPTRVRGGSTLRAPDIRGGAALVVAALSSSGQTRIENWHEIERGYVRLEERLSSLGADILVHTVEQLIG